MRGEHVNHIGIWATLRVLLLVWIMGNVGSSEKKSDTILPFKESSMAIM